MQPVERLSAYAPIVISAAYRLPTEFFRVGVPDRTAPATPLIVRKQFMAPMQVPRRHCGSRVLALQKISDRLEIEQLLIEYAACLDSRNFDGWDNVFTPDAYIDYRAMGGIDGKYPQVKAWVKTIIASFPNYYHMMGNMVIKVDGDQASSRTTCFNPMELDIGNGKTQVFFLGLWYVDVLVRTPTGWRICERVEERCFEYNVPSEIKRITG